jgi:hypothetical protein
MKRRSVLGGGRPFFKGVAIVGARHTAAIIAL